MTTIDTQSTKLAETSSGRSPFHVFHAELRALASAKMAGEAPGHALQPADLINETWLRLEGKGRREWNDRTHFLSVAAGVMRNILIDQARRERSQKHGGGWVRASETTLGRVAVDSREELRAVDEALQRFAALDPFKADLVRRRYYDGLTISEVAVALGISEPTAKRHWTYARAWLFRAVTADSNGTIASGVA